MWSGMVARGLAALAVASLSGRPASAHHVMDGELPQTFLQGLLSGLGHPVIGPDHLAFIIAIGIAAALVPAGVRLIAAFVAASTVGVLVHLGSVDVPMNEVMVAGSVIIAGGLIALGQRSGSAGWLALALLAGLVHGYAFGESIVGAERSVIGAYLVGIALVAFAVALGVMMVARALVASGDAVTARLRAAGVTLACAGAVMLAIGLTAAPA